MVKGGRVMHGVGLLRISKTPVTVDTEEYVVFVNGRLATRGFASWREANIYFLAWVESKKMPPQKRLRSGVKRRSGIRPGEIAYRNAIRAQEALDD